MDKSKFVHIVSTKAQTKTCKKLIKKRFGEGFFFDIPPRGNARSAQVTTLMAGATELLRMTVACAARIEEALK